MQYVTFPDEDNRYSSYFRFESNKEKIKKNCQISILNQTMDQAVSIDKKVWAITTNWLQKSQNKKWSHLSMCTKYCVKEMKYIYLLCQIGY